MATPHTLGSGLRRQTEQAVSLDAHMRGDSNWTHVDVMLDTGTEAYIMPQLALYGEGIA